MRVRLKNPPRYLGGYLLRAACPRGEHDLFERADRECSDGKIFRPGRQARSQESPPCRLGFAARRLSTCSMDFPPAIRSIEFCKIGQRQPGTSAEFRRLNSSPGFSNSWSRLTDVSRPDTPEDWSIHRRRSPTPLRCMTE